MSLRPNERLLHPTKICSAICPPMTCGTLLPEVRRGRQILADCDIKLRAFELTQC